MRKLVVTGVALAAVTSLSACGKSGYDRARPDEFAVARQAPLVIPPDFSLVPPQPGAARTQGTNTQGQTLEALFGTPAPRSQTEAGVVDQAGGDVAQPGIRSAVGDPQTNVIDKGQTTRDIIAAPQGDGQGARAVTGGAAGATQATAPSPAATPAPDATPQP